MGFAPRALLAGGLGFAVSFLVACGGGKGLLSSNDASSLNSQLDAVSNAVDAGHCGGTVRAVARLGDAVNNLPVTVNAKLRASLLTGVTTVGKLAPRDCARTAASSTTSTTTTPSSSTSTTTTTTTPSTSTTTTTTTTPSTSTTTTTTQSSTTTTTPSSTTTTGPTTTGLTGGAGIGGGGGNNG